MRGQQRTHSLVRAAEHVPLFARKHGRFDGPDGPPARLAWKRRRGDEDDRVERLAEAVAERVDVQPHRARRRHQRRKRAMSRAEASVARLLTNRRRCPQFSATGEKRLSDLQIDRGDKKSTSRKTAVYKYSPPIVTAEREPGLPSTKRVRAHTPNVGGRKKSARKTKELLAGGDRRHG